jgi:hypothetical protein
MSWSILVRESLQRFPRFTACLAGRHDPVGLTDHTAIEARILAFRAGRGADR